MKTDLFDYELPGELIAFHPSPKRDESRLLVVPPLGGLVHGGVSSLPDHIPEGALMILNDTRVVPARLRARRPTGGAVEVLLVRMTADGEGASEWLAMCRSNKPLRPGDRLILGGGMSARVEAKGPGGDVDILIDAPPSAVREHMESAGEVPLPPYINRPVEPEDRERYQTVFATRDGSVAAPTAGLHFTPALLRALEERGVGIEFITLHVGPGTFRPIKADSLEEHTMDEEYFVIDERAEWAIAEAVEGGRPVIAVGTTVVRALEGRAAAEGSVTAGAGATEIFISPPFEFRVVDGLMTNFHLPRSTLLCLVSALVGRERILDAYREAVERGYRFYSYGDAMLLLPGKR